VPLLLSSEQLASKIRLNTRPSPADPFCSIILPSACNFTVKNAAYLLTESGAKSTVLFEKAEDEAWLVY